MSVRLIKEAKNRYKGYINAYGNEFSITGEKQNEWYLSPGGFWAKKEECKIIKKHTVEMGNKLAGVVGGCMDGRR